MLPFSVDDNGYLIRKVESQAQIVVPISPRPRIPHLAHFSKLAGYPGGRKLYHILRRDFYWSGLAVDCYGTVRECATCAKNRIKLKRNRKHMTLFPATAPLECVSIDILGEFLHTKRRNCFFLVINDRFSKLTRTVPLRKITAAEVANAFVNNWVFTYSPPVYLLSDNGPQFTARLFQDICRILEIENLFVTTYHPQCNEQVERFNRTILAALRHYVADHPKDGDLFTNALTYAYNTQTHRGTKSSPFELVLSRPPSPLALQSQPAISQLSKSAHSHSKWKRMVIEDNMYCKNGNRKSSAKEQARLR